MHAKPRTPYAYLAALLAAAFLVLLWPSPSAHSSSTSRLHSTAAIKPFSPVAQCAPGTCVSVEAVTQADLKQYAARSLLLAAAMSATTTVQSGDSLSVIARRVYGNPAAWTVLYYANKHLIGQSTVIMTGWRLTVPPLPSSIPPAPLFSPPVAVAAAVVTTASAPSAQPVGSLQAYAQQLLSAHGWGGQFSCLNSVIMRESSWNVYASNASGAYGIPQALPGSKMAVAGADWATSGYTQLRWMINDYIGRWGGPCGAWAQEQAAGWY